MIVFVIVATTLLLTTIAYRAGERTAYKRGWVAGYLTGVARGFFDGQARRSVGRTP